MSPPGGLLHMMKEVGGLGSRGQLFTNTGTAVRGKRGDVAQINGRAGKNKPSIKKGPVK